MKLLVIAFGITHIMLFNTLESLLRTLQKLYNVFVHAKREETLEL